MNRKIRIHWGLGIRIRIPRRLDIRTGWGVSVSEQNRRLGIQTISLFVRIPRPPFTVRIPRRVSISKHISSDTETLKICTVKSVQIPRPLRSKSCQKEKNDFISASRLAIEVLLTFLSSPYSDLYNPE